MHRLLNNAAQAASNAPDDTPDPFTLGAAPDSFQTFISAGLADQDTAEFRAAEVDAGVEQGPWELFLGRLDTGSPDAIARLTLIESSTGSWIDWTGKTVRITATPSSQRLSEPQRRVEFNDVASVELVGLFEAGFNYRLMFMISCLANSTSLQLQGRMRRVGESSFDSGASDYVSNLRGLNAGSAGSVLAIDSLIQYTAATVRGDGAASASAWNEITGLFIVQHPRDTDRVTDLTGQVTWGVQAGNANSSVMHGRVFRASKAAIDGLSFFASSGNIRGWVELIRLPKVT